MCRGEIDIPAIEDRHGIHFLEYFHTDLLRLSDLAADGLVETSETRITATSRGRLLLRIIAACFDHYLHSSLVMPAQYSKSV
jgi:oxygen-independent coproporphyrinogen-3 oxidase